MNAFQKVLEREHADDTRLGMPSRDAAHMLRRATIMASMTGNRGFRLQTKEPRTDAQGLTRGDRKRKARAAAMAKVSESRAPEFMHSAAKRRAGYEYDWRSNGYVRRAA